MVRQPVEPVVAGASEEGGPGCWTGPPVWRQSWQPNLSYRSNQGSVAPRRRLWLPAGRWVQVSFQIEAGIEWFTHAMRGDSFERMLGEPDSGGQLPAMHVDPSAIERRQQYVHLYLSVHRLRGGGLAGPTRSSSTSSIPWW